VVYGLPMGDTLELAAEGMVILGGCILSPEDPDYLCQLCARLAVAPSSTIPGARHGREDVAGVP
jgi:hypothetical protein